MVRGRFITLEGTEGVGKSTNLAFLAGVLQQRGISLVQTREPGGTPFAEELRRVLLALRDERVDPMAELLTIFAARAQHIAEVIEPALSAGKWVLCDRFTDATYAYQCGGRGVSQAIVAQLETLVQGEFRPDAVIVLDAPPDIGMQRAEKRAALDRFESEKTAFFMRVRSVYLERATRLPGYHVVDASRPLVEVQLSLSRIVSELEA